MLEYRQYVYLLPLIIALGLLSAYQPLAAGGAVAGALVLLLFTLKTEYFVLAIAIYTPLEEFILKWLPQEAYLPARYAWEGLLIAVFFLVLFRNFIQKGRIWRATPVDLPVLLLLVAAVLSALVNEVPPFIAALGMKNLVRYILLYYIVVNSDFSERFARTLVYALMAMAFVEAVIGIGQYVIGDAAYKFLRASAVEVGGVAVREVTSEDTSKVFGTMGRYNMLGNFLNFFMVMAMGLYYARQKKSHTGYAVFFGVTLVGLVLTFSRMSWLGLYIGFILILLIQRKKRVIIYVMLPVVMTAMLLAAYEGLNWYKGETSKASAVERYVSMFTSGYVEKAARYDRLYALLVTAPTVIERYPLFGLGPGTFASEVTGSGTHDKGLYPEYSHEDWLGINNKEALQYTSDQGWTGILCQLGLAGLLCFAWIFTILIRYSYAAYKASEEPFKKGVALGFLGCIFLLVFQNFVSFNLTYRAVSLYLWLFAAVVFNLYSKERCIEKETA